MKTSDTAGGFKGSLFGGDNKKDTFFSSSKDPNKPLFGLQSSNK